MSITVTTYGSLCLELLEVGDEVAIEGATFTNSAAEARLAKVCKVIKTQVKVEYKSNLVGPSQLTTTSFMKSTGREVGSSSSWRSRRLITVEKKTNAQTQQHVEAQIEHFEKMAHTHLESMLRAERELPERNGDNEPLNPSVIRTIGSDLTECLVNAWKLRHGMPITEITD